MSLPVIGVLALQGDIDEHRQAVDFTGLSSASVRTPQDLDEVDALIIPGGESTTMSRLLRVFSMDQPISQRLAAGMPVYGSCAGMILLASKVLDTRADAVSFGSIDMTVRRNAFGRQVDSFEQDLRFDGFDEPFRGVFIRAPGVESVDPDVEVLASVELSDGRRVPVAVRQGNRLATSFHPEVTGDPRIHQYFADMVLGN